LATIVALPEGFRDALLAVNLVGLSYREAARLLDAPEATITTRLFRARQRIARSTSAAASPISGPRALRRRRGGARLGPRVGGRGRATDALPLPM
jgi:predicted RNA polymerase sigma factor